MIEIKRNFPDIEKDNENEEIKRNIEFDKTIPFEILYKPVKVTLKEKEILNLNKNYMNILTLAYTKEDGSKDEFVLGNLNNIGIEDGKINLHEYINNINKFIQGAYGRINKNESKLTKTNAITSILDDLKNVLEKNYRIKYTQEGYGMFYGDSKYQTKYENKKTLEVINDGTFNNLEFYSDTDKQNAFEGEKKHELNNDEKMDFVDELKNNVNNENEIHLASENSEVKTKKIYLETIDTDEKIKEFFENNRDILEYYTELCKKDESFEKAFNNFQSGKTNINNESAAKVISRTIFNYLKNIIIDDPIGLKNINLPSKRKENDNLAIT